MNMKKQPTITVVVENPKGSCNVYRNDHELDNFYLERVMSKGMSFPCDFGYIQSTTGTNGHPLSAVIIGDCHTFVGCKIRCRVVGGLLSTQIEEDGTSITMQHFLVLPIADGVQQIRNLSELPNIVLENLKSFLINDHATIGKKLKFTGKLDHTDATKFVNEASTEQEIKFKLELVLPQIDSSGKLFDKALFEELNRELIKKFNGLTVYSRLPAEGFWKTKDATVQQTVVVYQLMLACIDHPYWQQLKANLEKKFNQTEVMITYGPSRQVK